MKRLRSVRVALALGFLVGLAAAQVPQLFRSVLTGMGSTAATQQPDAHKDHDGKDGQGHGPEAKEGVVAMTEERITAAKIGVVPVAAGDLSRRLSVPATVTADRDRIGRVAARVSGTVVELRKGLGDVVQKGEVIAILDSREVADAKSEFTAARVNFELQKTLFDRTQTLRDKQITAEQTFLKAQVAYTEAQLRLDLARQKLFALGVTEPEIAALAKAAQGQNGLQRYEIRAPMAGRIVERMVDLGAPVGGEGQPKELYSIADLSTVWVEITVSTTDLPQIKDGQPVAITESGSDKASEGRIVFISPILSPDTRSARVIASVVNKDLMWRPGTFVTAHVAVEQHRVNLKVPRSALQTINNEPVLFVRTPAGFEKRIVALGKEDAQDVEIVFGINPGEQIAAVNSFLLKAELGKAEASHAH
jgi:cobalt-zinc-cadmium efflux system membrane fusion protein